MSGSGSSNAIEKRQLGKNGPMVSAVGLGCMSLSGIYGKSDDDAAIKLVHHAIDTGVNMLDSADMYGWGQNEELVGRAIKGRRDKVVLATKFGQVRGEKGNTVDGRPEYVMQACAASLKRLGVDVIDLYYQHRVDPNVPIEDTVGAMKRLVEQGKVRFIGLSEAAPETIKRAHKVHPLSALQSEYSLLFRTDAEETLPVLRERGIAFVAYAPLGRSLLSGKIKTPDDIAGDRRIDHPRFQGENFARNVELAEIVGQLAKEKGATTAQVALAWLLAQGPDIVPIPGTKRIERFDENLGALRVKLTAAEVSRLSNALPPGAGAGLRYPAGQMKAVHV